MTQDTIETYELAVQAFKQLAATLRKDQYRSSDIEKARQHALAAATSLEEAISTQRAGGLRDAG
ncbi:hypothetical protein [Spiribacter onubensis]|uniref:Uncharacterized protein n=1 Tax=Spiribacter onubensis TaxID=3122420 RepID=A0ABV3S917_9GAMM